MPDLNSENLVTSTTSTKCIRIDSFMGRGKELTNVPKGAIDDGSKRKNFCLQFHWCPQMSCKETTRDVNLNLLHAVHEQKRLLEIGNVNNCVLMSMLMDFYLTKRY